MHKVMAATMIGIAFTFGGFWLAHAQEDGTGTNGQAPSGWADMATATELDRAYQLMSEDGHEQEVIDLCLELLPALEGGDDNAHLVDCLFLLGEAYYHTSNWAKGEQFMRQAFDTGTAHFPDDIDSYPLKVVGECQFEQGLMEKALATFNERVELIREQENEIDLAGALFDVGGVLINLGQEEEAITVLTEALSANDVRAQALAADPAHATDEARTGTVVDHAEIAYHLAIANYRLEQYAEAKIFLETAYNFFTKVQEAGVYDVSDRLVAVLDDLVLVSENLGDSLAASRYQRERDELNN